LERPGNTVKSSGREAHLGRPSQPPSSETLGVTTVMLDSKRRPASTQAVSERLKGLSPVIRSTGRTTASDVRKSNSGATRKGRGGVRFLGDRRPWHACTSRLHGNPGDRCRCFRRPTQPHHNRNSKRAFRLAIFCDSQLYVAQRARGLQLAPIKIPRIGGLTFRFAVRKVPRLLGGQLLNIASELFEETVQFRFIRQIR